MRPMPSEYPAWNGGEVRIIDGRRRFGYYVDGEWIDIGRAFIAMTRCDEETGYYEMHWVPESMLPEKLRALLEPK